VARQRRRSPIVVAVIGGVVDDQDRSVTPEMGQPAGHHGDDGEGERRSRGSVEQRDRQRADHCRHLCIG
jgi:hypothetical protein